MTDEELVQKIMYAATNRAISELFIVSVSLMYLDRVVEEENKSK